MSTDDQRAGLQTDALQVAGCVRIFTDTASGGLNKRAELEQALDHLLSKLGLLVRALGHFPNRC